MRSSKGRRSSHRGSGYDDVDSDFQSMDDSASSDPASWMPSEEMRALIRKIQVNLASLFSKIITHMHRWPCFVLDRLERLRGAQKKSDKERFSNFFFLGGVKNI